MEIIAHRKNSISQLIATDTSLGIEVDIRSYGQTLVTCHDPFTTGEDFRSWLSKYSHGTLILNVKEEGLEERLINLMQEFSIKHYFFLDQSFPFLVKWANLGERNCAVRVSEYESVETVKSLAGKIDWVWVDCFTKFPITGEQAAILKKLGFKLCLVSPELQGQEAFTTIQQLRSLLNYQNIKADAVCTKRPDLWY